MKRLVREDLLGSLTNPDLPICEHGLTGKAIKKPFSKGIKVELPLQFVHSNICDPLNVRTSHKASYFITFINNFMCFNYVYLISYKSWDWFIRYNNFGKESIKQNNKGIEN